MFLFDDAIQLFIVNSRRFEEMSAFPAAVSFHYETDISDMT